MLAIYNRNVFPDLKVTWGTYPNNLGHTDFPGCFRCHDGSHTAADGKTISQDCSACHESLAMEEANAWDSEDARNSRAALQNPKAINWKSNLATRLES